MGYRSDVAYKIDFHDEGQWNLFLIEAKSKPDTRDCFEDEDMTVDYEKHQVKFVASSVKWYEDYPDVKCHCHLLELVDEYNERNKNQDVASYLFKRVGEAEDDVEERHGGDPDWDDIYLRRELIVNW